MSNSTFRQALPKSDGIAGLAGDPRDTAVITRTRVRHPLVARHVTVSATHKVAPSMVRVTVRGAELSGFDSRGPSDHVKVFFPDANTGIVAVPHFTEGKPSPPAEGTVIARDYTPLEYRENAPGGPELDLDFVLHGDHGPASAWAARAAVGDPLVIAGPRGSHLAPTGLTSAVLVADETALPAASRWLRVLDASVAITGLFSVADIATADYFDAVEGGATLRWFAGQGRDAALEQALRALTFDARTFVMLAGESTSLVPLRRFLRRELGLAREQVDAQGYWKKGQVNFDHHAPLDPDDVDD